MALEGVGSGGGRYVGKTTTTKKTPTNGFVGGGGSFDGWAGGGGSFDNWAGGGGSFDTAPATVAPQITPPPAYTPIDLGGGGGGGGGAPAVAAPPPPPTISLDDFIRNNFLYTTRQNENSRLQDDFDAATLEGEQETQAQQGLRHQALQKYLNRAGQANADDFAARGLGRSGLVFAAQDDINDYGEEQNRTIDDLLTNFRRGRADSRKDLLNSNRSALDSVIAQLTDKFNQDQAARLAPQGG